ncbi:GNAT family N-acetyltransferase [Celerinatantimonas diazotrophica]|uniref:Ribosomal protein S18 acetylase RimI-like enzyme n=1 Tax=Celerinatantimonas diazotrophica TaxID=412034 RepID=A0A4R1JAM4_9GAMM|nr:GNAT family N-acetyltransferase [Celerinatantimonas diazotrophica]TCK47547.1 ribosomal protein S18 acetylase RimI-like enzyme [Celerinatantimonas diazotrophica]CAG9296835.1 hypothetical protein CEDIAZO_01994 [Celerinatantimonas diazotrophica]
MSILIRQLTLDDVHEAAVIFDEMYQFYFAKPPQFVDIEPYLCKRVLSDNSPMTVMGIFSDDKLVGFATFTILFPAPALSGQMFIKDLFISEQYRAQRLGLKLLKYLAKLALENSCSRLDWTAEQSNPKAGAFYRKIGATHVTDKEYFRFSDEALSRFAEYEF